MTHNRMFHLLCGILAVLCPALILASCSSASASSGSTKKSSTSQAEKKETVRPNTPKVHMPEASGTAVLGAEPLVIDVSHTDQGYIMAQYTGDAAKANIQIDGPDGINYKYFITSGPYVTMPLTSGDGSYTISTYENITGDKYAALYSETIDVKLESDFIPYLYPNQYVDFTPESKAVKTAQEQVKTATSDLDAVADIYYYVTETISYDEEKAKTVPTVYLPDLDETLSSCEGICFDYASLMTAMLRSQDIPTKLEIGYSGKVYHAWISVYIKDVGWIDNIIEFDGKSWKRMDPTFASSNKNSKKILKYIGDGNNYTVRYTR